jgi:hypothetical protein
MNVGAILVVALGLAMLSQGGVLSGFLPPDLLIQIILALSVVGVVSILPFRKPSYRAASTIAAFGLAILVIISVNLFNASTDKGAQSDAPIAISDISVTPITDEQQITGSAADASAQTDNSATDNDLPATDEQQIVNSTLAPRKYPNITVQVGMPVKWIINASEGNITNCNVRMLIQEYGIEYTFVPGENIIEFTPEKVGTVRYSCWMGMIHGNITIVDAET